VASGSTDPGNAEMKALNSVEPTGVKNNNTPLVPDSHKPDLAGTNLGAKRAEKDNPKVQEKILEQLQAKSAIAKYAPVWDSYVNQTEEEDKDLVEDWDR
jgi:hypothetical protein